jgi:hypothetical protein
MLVERSTPTLWLLPIEFAVSELPLEASLAQIDDPESFVFVHRCWNGSFLIHPVSEESERGGWRGFLISPHDTTSLNAVLEALVRSPGNGFVVSTDSQSFGFLREDAFHSVIAEGGFELLVPVDD